MSSWTSSEVGRPGRAAHDSGKGDPCPEPGARGAVPTATQRKVHLGAAWPHPAQST